jgi:predicted transposase YbfD/YdcC
MPPIEVQSKGFYGALQNLDLDLRDNRGKRQDLSIILVGLVLAMLSKRDGVLSSMHRHMCSNYAKLCGELGVPVSRPVSRAQLPLILAKTAVSRLEPLIQAYFGSTLGQADKKWFSADGKELRGTIAQGETRGEAVVLVVSHEDGKVAGETFHNGLKESEIPSVRELLRSTGVEKEKVTLDALHCNPQTTAQVNGAKGIYLVGLKENQPELLAEMKFIAKNDRCLDRVRMPPEKGHGRLEVREYWAFSTQSGYVDKRWKESGLATLVVVERETTILKKGAKSKETAYYLSNLNCQTPGASKELFTAVRNHWSVEASNWIRDVTFREDQLMVSHPPVARCAAVCRTIALGIIRVIKPPSIVARLEDYADSFSMLIMDLKKIGFL